MGWGGGGLAFCLLIVGAIVFSLACGDCSAVLSMDEAAGHTCTTTTTRLQFDCPACRLPFTSQEVLESHIVNMWCTKLRIFNSMPSVRDIQVPYRY